MAKLNSYMGEFSHINVPGILNTVDYLKFFSSFLVKGCSVRCTIAGNVYCMGLVPLLNSHTFLMKGCSVRCTYNW